MTEPQHIYRSLAFDSNRQALAADIKKVRQEVLRLIELVPKAKRYEVRYHGWSPGAMLSHLHFMDNATLCLMRVAEQGIVLPLPRSALNLFNNNLARLFKRMDIEKTVRQIQSNEARLIAFVLHLPARQFVRKVYAPCLESYLTLEEAVQEFLLIHWQGHLQTMREVDDKGFYEPGAISTDLL
jgi:hypothetical protein